MPEPRPTDRPPRLAAFALGRLRASPVLRICALLAFVEYGALLFLAAFGARLRPNFWQGGANFQLAGWLALCSLGSWFSIFAWFPFLQTLQDRDGGEGAAVWMGRTLEIFAISCVAVVHGVMAWILVLTIR